MRCLALAQTLAEMKANVWFFVSEQTLPICKARHDWVGRVVTLPDMTAEQEIAWLAEQSKQHSASIVILDGYQFTSDYRASLKLHFQHIVLFDDLNDSGPLHADLVINSAEQAEMLGYQTTAPDAELCLGNDFRILRQEFVELVPNDWSQRKDLVICFGGSDPKGFTLETLAVLENLEIDMPIRVITGPAYAELDKLKAWLTTTNLVVQHLHDCQQMADVFNHAKFVVSAAGGTQFELLATGTPSLLVMLADNQQPATIASAALGWCDYVDAREAFDADELAEKVLALIQNDNTLLTMHENALSNRDLEGAYRVAEKIRQLTI